MRNDLKFISTDFLETINFNPFPVLTTDRLILRQMNISDENEIFQLRTDDRVQKYLDRPKANSLDDVRKFIERIDTGIANNENIMWGVCRKNDDMLIGTVCYFNIIKDDSKAEIGYELLPDYQGKGFMQEAFTQVIDYGFNVLKLELIEAVIHPENSRSIKLIERNGFTYKGKLKDVAVYILNRKA